MRELVPARADEVGRAARANDEHDERDDADAERRPRADDRDPPPHPNIAFAREQAARELDHDDDAAHEEQPEDQTVVHARVVRLVVVRNPRQQQRVAGDDRGDRRGDQQGDERVQSLPVEPDPDDRAGDR